MADGHAYFNIHTSMFTGGEIRGFLAPVPIPAAAWLFGSGLLGLMGIARQRRQLPV
ncbi:CHRD domain-containing protein [Sulfuricaulis sp.]|uniref:CHRD domain-containing protein n=1 Tax=Sulfuricaulis sp. TaxID=2003553 RepID=UPI003C7359C0